jgi:hypothetical protein
MRQVRWNRHDYFVPLSEGVRRKSRDEESEAGGGTSPALCKNWKPRNVSWCVFCACCHCVEHRSIKFIYLKHEFLSPCAKRHGAEISPGPGTSNETTFEAFPVVRLLGMSESR